jgi:hypothetical protein
MIYSIWCEVSGGRTGSRAAWLKKDGTIQMWTDKATAEWEAAALNGSMNRPNSKVVFTFTVQER